MKMFFITLLALALSGCVTATYKADQNAEIFTLTSLFKSVDGLDTQKGNGEFYMKIDKTHSQDPIASMVEMFQLIQLMQLGVAPIPQSIPQPPGD